MASNKLEIVEQCKISPFPLLHSPKSLPLTFFDVVFLPFPPVQRVFFFDYPHPKFCFFDFELPNLKHSLSLAIHHFYPLAGTLIKGQKPEILCSVNDSVSFTVGVSNANFYDLSGNHIQNVTKFHPVVPSLFVSDETKTTVFAIQVTVFPNAGICIGTTVHHAIADGSTYTNFMKAWSSLDFATNSPSFDRNFIRDPKNLKTIFLKDLELLDDDESLKEWDLYGHASIVRSTFILTVAQLTKLGNKTTMQFSPYSLACGYIWSCLVKTRGDASKKTEHFGFVTGCRARHNPPLPVSYFGNCLGICRVEAKRKDLVGGNGAAVAAEAIWRAIKNLEQGVFTKADDWIKNVYDYAKKKALTVAGSPKLGVYEVDFGWGRPRKVDIVSIERTGALSLAESRDEKGGIEVGLALPKFVMEKFVSLFVDGLIDI